MENIITPTAIELWGDRRFIERRIREQYEYLNRLLVRFRSNLITYDRYLELQGSAIELVLSLENRLREL
jgi:hypothetical protein